MPCIALTKFLVFLPESQCGGYVEVERTSFTLLHRLGISLLFPFSCFPSIPDPLPQPFLCLEEDFSVLTWQFVEQC